jgi:hypothetical protein
VVGRERARQRAAVERLEDRRLDLEEAVVVERAADRGDDPGARGEELAGLLVGDEVELAAAVARLDVLQAVELLRRRPQGLREQRPVLDAQRQLAAARHEGDAVDADEVAEVQAEERLHRLGAEDVGARLQLDAPAAVDEVQERHPALAAARGETAGDAMARLGLLTGLQARVGRADVRDRLDARVGVRERLDPVRAQALELLPPDGEQLVGHSEPF